MRVLPAPVATLFLAATVRGERRLRLCRFVSTCPTTAVGRRLSGPSLGSLQRGEVVLRTARAQRLSSRGGNRATATALNGAAGDCCKGVRTRRGPNTATYQARSPGFTLLGTPAVQATIRRSGAGRFGARRRFKLELLGRDAPYAQAPQRAFSVRVLRLRLALPTAERGTEGSSG